MTNSEILFALEEQPFGRSWEDWAIEWCRWLFSIPGDRNPALDRSGQYSTENQILPTVWFLTGTSQPNTLNECVTRTCRIPRGYAIFFPIVVAVSSTAEDPNLVTEEQLMSKANAIINEVNVNDLDTNIDSIKINVLEKYRIRSRLFYLDLPNNNIIQMKFAHVREGKTSTVADGYWIFIKPLNPGEHIVHFGLEEQLREDYTVDGEVTYRIHIP